MKLGPLLVAILASAGLVSAQSRIDCTSIESHMLHRPVRYCVMLPSNYEKETRKYPVLYFLHGLGENEQALMRSGGWGLIEDLSREHKVGDFIMVAPEGRPREFEAARKGESARNARPPVP